MNNGESKLSKPMSRKESQPSPQQAGSTQSSVTGSQLRQKSPSPREEDCNHSSILSSGEGISGSENENKKTSSADEKLQSREQQSSVLIYSDSSAAQSTDILRTVPKNQFSKGRPISEKESSTDLTYNSSEEILQISTFNIPVKELEDVQNQFLESEKLRDSRTPPELDSPPTSVSPESVELRTPELYIPPTPESLESGELCDNRPSPELVSLPTPELGNVTSQSPYLYRNITPINCGQKSTKRRKISVDYHGLMKNWTTESRKEMKLDPTNVYRLGVSGKTPCFRNHALPGYLKIPLKDRRNSRQKNRQLKN